MLKEIKEQLIENPENIVTLLEEFDFEHISLRSKEIRFARNSQGGPNIRIRLEDNDYLNVNDYARGVRADIFSYIIDEKNVTFRDVIRATKRILKLDDNWAPPKRRSLFGGIYQHIINPNSDIKLKVYDDKILEQYDRCGNQRFLRDGISLKTQNFWNIRFSIKDDAIIIPIYNEYSELVGVKSRINRDPENDESKYFYEVPVAMSQLLYGYGENYSYLYGNDVILVESEKSVMQAMDFNVRNIVALGSHSLSEKQTKLLFQLQPKRIIIAMDEGLKHEHIMRNVDMIKSFGTIVMPEVWYWDSTVDSDILHKSSPTDMGKAKFEEIMKDQLVRIY